MVNKNVLSCLLKDGKEVNAVMLVGRLFHATDLYLLLFIFIPQWFHARATVTRNDRSRLTILHYLDGVDRWDMMRQRKDLLRFSGCTAERSLAQNE